MGWIRRIIKVSVPWIVVGFVAWFFYNTLSSNWDKVKTYSFEVDGWIVAGIICFTMAVVASGALWGRLLTTLAGRNVAVLEAVRIHSASWLLKYVPGQVGSYINKITWAKKHDITKKTVTTSFIYENVLMVFAGFLLSIPVLFLFSSQVGREARIFLPLLLLVPFLIVLYRPVFYRLLNFVFAKLGKKAFPASDFLSTSTLMQYQCGYVLPRLLNGVGFVCIAVSFLPVDPSMYVGLGAAYILASIVGLLALFVPGGIGVREAVIVLLVSVYFPVEQAVLLALVARLYATIADLGVAGVYLLLNKGRIRQL